MKKPSASTLCYMTAFVHAVILVFELLLVVDPQKLQRIMFLKVAIVHILLWVSIGIGREK